MLVDIVMPKMGESIQEGKILRWMKKPGDKVELDETILEISTDKVDSEIPSPSAGVLAKIVVPEGDTVEVGTVIAVIETNLAAPVAQMPAPNPQSDTRAVAPAVAREVELPIPETLAEKPVRRDGNRFYSPLVRSIAGKEGVSLNELEKIEGSGAGGRVTKKDIAEYLKARTAKPFATPATLKFADFGELQKRYPAPAYEIVQMDNLQQRMAEHMVRSVHTSPHVEAISECDFTMIADFRAKQADRFERQEGFKLTFMPFLVEATVRALKSFPIINSSIEGDKIILKKSVNFGLAVASPAGLIVPVIRHADEKNFVGIARAINDLAQRARVKKLLPDEIQGGTFTLTNFGIFGNIIGTPIINQPQVAILGVGAIKKRPVVLTDAEGNDSIGIRSIGFLTLAFDHRIIDGALGGQFLASIVTNLEQYDFSKVY
jgi:2-oxoglutarate dehydrogenase E2 component (dihydrolipoamide succinyltransferase)